MEEESIYYGLLAIFKEKEEENEDEEEEENVLVSGGEFSAAIAFLLGLEQRELIAENSGDDFGLAALFEEQEMESFPMADCDICTDRKENGEMCSIEGCLHSFCMDCISKHVAAKLEDNISTIKCPGLNCKSILEIEIFRPLLPKTVLHQWEEALCKSMLAASPTFHCPFKDCSAMLLNDNKEEIVRESECPYCHRLFCAECNVPWHPGVDCEEYQRLNEDEKGRDDLMVRELAKEKKWARCPQCKYIVERTEGCLHITCRCQFQFCYGCGSEWNGNHGSC